MSDVKKKKLMNAIKSSPMSIEDKQDFANIVLEGGGGGASESSIEYLDVSGHSFAEWGEAFAVTAVLVKKPTKIITLSLMAMMKEEVNGATAFAMYPKMEFDWQETRMTVEDFLLLMGVDLSTYPRLTKEQFYSLE